MRWLYKLPLRLRSLFRKDRVEMELTDELRFHLEQLIEEKVGQRMTAEEARYAALRELGEWNKSRRSAVACAEQITSRVLSGMWGTVFGC